MLMRQIFDPKLAQYAYLIGCPRTKEALLVDPQRDTDRYLDLARGLGLAITAVAETHIHADFLSGAQTLAHDQGVDVYVSKEGGEDWRYEWIRQPTYAGHEVADGETFRVGMLRIEALHTPGHTPEHLSYLVTDAESSATENVAVITGDFIFAGDMGRPDLLESSMGLVGTRETSARQLFSSLQRLLALPDFLQIWPGHGAGSLCGKSPGTLSISTLGYERRTNPAIAAARESEEAFLSYILDAQPEPPGYFAHMKLLNRTGTTILGELPIPPLAPTEALLAAINDPDTTVLDTRCFRREFMNAHLAGSLHAPLGPTFASTVGSYVHPDDKLFLITAPERLEETVRDLVRIGYSRLAGYVRPQALSDPTLAPARRRTPVLDFHQLATVLDHPNTVVVDVREEAEYAARHVAGALHLAHTRILDEMERLAPESEIVVHCATGARAAAAAAALERAGRRVCLVDDAFDRWAGAS